MKHFGRFLWHSVVMTFLLLLIFIVLNWLDVPSGRFLDWVIGIASFWWLLVIVTVPWNIYFQARSVLDDAQLSREKLLPVEPEHMAYVHLVRRRSLMIAVALHVLSALGFYALAATGVSPIGYISAGAALALTVLRPALRSYEYLAERLGMIRQSLRYPREDVVKLRQELKEIQGTVKGLAAQLDLENPDSWALRQQGELAALRKDLERQRVQLNDLRSTNQAEHLRLAREAENAIAQISTDGQVLEHVREIIRFFKTA